VLGLAFIAFLLVLGLTASDENDGSSKRASRAGKEAHRGKERKAAAAPAPVSRRKVKLAVVAARPVWVCVVDAHDRPRVAGRTLAAGDRVGPFTARSFKITVGNGGGDLQINGKLRDTPDRPVPLGFSVDASGTNVLPPSERPTCG
jgi:hypothetical protein